MENIAEFVNNVFAGFPQTRQTARMKADMIDTMTERYEDLLKSGKNEDEAFGIVVRDFGNIEDLRRELDVSSADGEPAGDAQKQDTLERNTRERSAQGRDSQERSAQGRCAHNRVKGYKGCSASHSEKCPVCYSLLMPGVAVLYLILGFAWGLWHPGWIIFPLAAFLCNAVCWLRNRRG